MCRATASKHWSAIIDGIKRFSMVADPNMPLRESRANEKGRHAPALSCAEAYFAGVSAGLPPSGTGAAGAGRLF
jgi:hypothetical protein